METDDIVFVPSAFKHGCTQTDIYAALETYRYDQPMVDKGNEDKHLLLGFDVNENLIEVMYNVIDDSKIKVFHAMKCRKHFIHLLGTKR